nr:hypothetical protein [Tanacetum cinerariifolium]
MSSPDSAVMYTSISFEDVPFWGICFFGMKQPDSPEAAPQSPIQTPPVPQDEDEREPMFIWPHDPDYDGSVDYPMDGGDDGDDDDGDSSGDDADDKDEDEKDEEEEEHLASVDSAVVVPTVEPVSPPEGTEHVIPPPSTDITTTGARITVQLQASISLPPETLRIGFTEALIDEVTAELPSPPLPPLPPPLYIPPPVDRKDDIPETELPPRKKSCLSTLGPRYEIEESSTARPIGDLVEAVPEIAPMTLGEVNTRVTELAELYEHDTQDLYALLEDAQDSRTRISRRIMAPMTRQRPNTPPNNTNPNNMTSKSVQSMIDQALLQNSTNEDGSHSSDGDNRRNVQTARHCFYADFMKCQPLNFKGTEGVVGLTRWIKKMESVF